MIYYILTKMMTLKESHFSLGLICHNAAKTFFKVEYAASTIFLQIIFQRLRKFKIFREIASL